MKKLSISRALIGLFVVLAVGIGLAACEVGEYESVQDNGIIKITTVIKLESGNKATSTATTTYSDGTPSSTTTMGGTYAVSGEIITITWTSYSVDGVAATGTYSQTEIYRLKDGALESISGYTKKSAAAEDTVIELEFADDFDFSVFDAE